MKKRRYGATQGVWEGYWKVRRDRPTDLFALGSGASKDSMKSREQRSLE